MKKKFKLGIIGCGSMGSAILRGAVLSEFLHEKKIIVSDISAKKLDDIDYLGVTAVTDNRYVAENSEFVLFAVKPQNFSEVVSDLKGIKPEKLISVMAGIKKNTIKNSFGTAVIKVARCMPNLPCVIGSGVVGVDMSDFNRSTDDADFISNLFNGVGTVLSINESKMDAVTAVSGSGPAYTFMFIDALIDAGTRQGLTKNEAKLLAVQTVLGSAELIQHEDASVSDLLLSVCSGGGTSIEAVKVLEECDFRGTINKAVEACAKRAVELSEK